MGKPIEVFDAGCIDRAPARAFVYGQQVGRVVFMPAKDDMPPHLDIRIADRSPLGGQQVTGTTDELASVFADPSEITWLLESLAVPVQRNVAAS